MVASRGIRPISLYVSVDGEQEAEAEIGDYADFYERLRASESGATTSQPSIGDFVSVYEPLLDEGREVVSVHLSAGISGTFDAAEPGPPAPDRRREGRRAGPALRLALGLWGQGLAVLAASAAARAGGDGAAASPAPSGRARS